MTKSCIYTEKVLYESKADFAQVYRLNCKSSVLLLFKFLIVCLFFFNIYFFPILLYKFLLKGCFPPFPFIDKLSPLSAGSQIPSGANEMLEYSLKCVSCNNI